MLYGIKKYLNIMKNNFIFIGFLFLSFPSVDAQISDSIYLWQGFQHYWSYNHRINRIGNFMEYPNREITYTSASGLGADSTKYLSGYELITESNLSSYQGKTSFEIKGKEGVKISLSKEIKIDLNENDQGKTFHAFLNGFDLLSKGKADKFEEFQVEISSINTALSSDFMSIKIDVILQADCSTLECQFFNQKVDYILDIYYLVLAGNKKEIQHTNYASLKNYNWDKSKEIKKENILSVIQGKTGFSNAVIGIKKIGIVFDEEHWLMEWSNYIQNKSYDKISGKMNFSLDLFYKEWAEKMKKESAYPKHSRFSKRGKGSVDLMLNLSLLQFKQGKTNTIVSKGNMFWQGRNHSANSDAAIDRKSIAD